MDTFTTISLKGLVSDKDGKALVAALRGRNIGWLTQMRVPASSNPKSYDRVAQIAKFNTEECIDIYTRLIHKLKTDPFGNTTSKSLTAARRHLTILKHLKEL